MGKLFDRADIEALMPEDGTYVVMLDMNMADFSPIYSVEKVDSFRGYEIGYDEIAQTHVERPSAYLEEGDRIGRWTDGERVVFDRVVHLDGPQQIAETLGRELNQQAIWSWADEACITL